MLHFLRRHVLNVGGDAPPVSKGILELPTSVAVEFVLRWTKHRGPRVDGLRALLADESGISSDASVVSAQYVDRSTDDTGWLGATGPIRVDATQAPSGARRAHHRRPQLLEVVVSTASACEESDAGRCDYS